MTSADRAHEPHRDETTIGHTLQTTVAVEEILPREARRVADLDGATFEVFFQPQVKATTHEIVSAEALVRARRTNGLKLNTGSWLPGLEADNQIAGLDLWVATTAVRVIADMRKSRPGLRLSVNMSPDRPAPTYAETLSEVCAEVGLPCEAVTVELTETVLVESIDSLAASAEVLRGHGFGIALDDFGTGWASMLLLKHLPATEIKVDREFVFDLPNKHVESQAITVGTLGMAKDLGVTTVAEGVETSDMLDAIAPLGFDTFQGWLFGEAMRADDLGCFLADYTPRTMVVVDEAERQRRFDAARKAEQDVPEPSVLTLNAEPSTSAAMVV